MQDFYNWLNNSLLSPVQTHSQNILQKAQSTWSNVTDSIHQMSKKTNNYLKSVYDTIQIGQQVASFIQSQRDQYDALNKKDSKTMTDHIMIVFHFALYQSIESISKILQSIHSLFSEKSTDTKNIFNASSTVNSTVRSYIDGFFTDLKNSMNSILNATQDSVNGKREQLNVNNAAFQSKPDNEKSIMDYGQQILRDISTNITLLLSNIIRIINNQIDAPALDKMNQSDPIINVKSDEFKAGQANTIIQPGDTTDSVKYTSSEVDNSDKRCDSSQTASQIQRGT